MSLTCIGTRRFQRVRLKAILLFVNKTLWILSRCTIHIVRPTLYDFQTSVMIMKLLSRRHIRVRRGQFVGLRHSAGDHSVPEILIPTMLAHGNCFRRVWHFSNIWLGHGRARGWSCAIALINPSNYYIRPKSVYDHTHGV